MNPQNQPHRTLRDYLTGTRRSGTAADFLAPAATPAPRSARLATAPQPAAASFLPPGRVSPPATGYRDPRDFLAGQRTGPGLSTNPLDRNLTRPPGAAQDFMQPSLPNPLAGVADVGRFLGEEYRAGGGGLAGAGRLGGAIVRRGKIEPYLRDAQLFTQGVGQAVSGGGSAVGGVLGGLTGAPAAPTDQALGAVDPFANPDPGRAIPPSGQPALTDHRPPPQPAAVPDYSAFLAATPQPVAGIPGVYKTAQPGAGFQGPLYGDSPARATAEGFLQPRRGTLSVIPGRSAEDQARIDQAVEGIERERVALADLHQARLLALDGRLAGQQQAEPGAEAFRKAEAAARKLSPRRAAEAFAAIAQAQAQAGNERYRAAQDFAARQSQAQADQVRALAGIDPRQGFMEAGGTLYDVRGGAPRAVPGSGGGEKGQREFFKAFSDYAAEMSKSDYGGFDPEAAGSLGAISAIANRLYAGNQALGGGKALDPALAYHAAKAMAEGKAQVVEIPDRQGRAQPFLAFEGLYLPIQPAG
ncbi:MAG: hypothetical protein M3Z21_16440 [Pseudomonadota bacterium]|nr:hypothetical protein [Pseudomonadota bacterium]